MFLMFGGEFIMLCFITNTTEETILVYEGFSYVSTKSEFQIATKNQLPLPLQN